MSSDRTVDLDHAKKGTAVLLACVAQTLGESDHTFLDRLLANLDHAYRKLRDDPSATVHELELLSWTRELLTGFNFVAGQGKPFFEE